MVIGKYGKILTFKVYLDPDKARDPRIKCLTFENLQRRVSSRVFQQEIILKPPKTQFGGPNAGTLDFTMTFSSMLGVNPRDMFGKLEKCIERGIKDYFVVGTKKVGKRKYIITDMSEMWDEIIKDGRLIQGNVDVTMEECS